MEIGHASDCPNNKQTTSNKITTLRNTYYDFAMGLVVSIVILFMVVAVMLWLFTVY
jgi:hypothetical protein